MKSKDAELWAFSKKRVLIHYGWSVVYMVGITVITILIAGFVGRSWLGVGIYIAGLLVACLVCSTMTLSALKCLMPTFLAWPCTVATFFIIIGLCMLCLLLVEA